MLAAIFGAERFHTYIYGQSFTIKSDHKLLESISRKNLADTPACVQCMMLCLQGYNFTIHYCPGKEMVIPDTLSQFSPWPGPNLPLDIAIHHAWIMPDCKEAFQQAFINDPEMRALANLIITGWPEDIKEEGVDHLVLGDFYSKMIFVQYLPPGQSNTNKVVSLLKEMFSESLALTMAHNMRVLSLLTSVYLGAYHTKPQVHITHNPMYLLKDASSLSNMHSKEPNIVVLTHSLPC